MGWDGKIIYIPITQLSSNTGIKIFDFILKNEEKSFYSNRTQIKRMFLFFTIGELWCFCPFQKTKAIGKKHEKGMENIPMKKAISKADREADFKSPSGSFETSFQESITSFFRGAEFEQ